MRAVFLRFPEVMELTGLSKATIYRQMEKGNFPKSVKLSERAVAWARDEIEEWLRKRATPGLDAGKAARLAWKRAERAAVEAEEATDQAALEAHRRGYSVEEAAEFMGCDPHRGRAPVRKAGTSHDQRVRVLQRLRIETSLVEQALVVGKSSER